MIRGLLCQVHFGDPKDGVPQLRQCMHKAFYVDVWAQVLLCGSHAKERASPNSLEILELPQTVVWEVL